MATTGVALHVDYPGLEQGCCYDHLNRITPLLLECQEVILTTPSSHERRKLVQELLTKLNSESIALREYDNDNVNFSSKLTIRDSYEFGLYLQIFSLVDLGLAQKFVHLVKLRPNIAIDTPQYFDGFVQLTKPRFLTMYKAMLGEPAKKSLVDLYVNDNK